MFANIFGDYLIKKGIISETQFLKIKEEQAKTRVKLGIIAVAEKMITEKQAEEINKKQAIMDKRFGDIAVGLGYLTEEQVGRLLGLQGNPYMLFIQTISDLGILSVAETEIALTEMQEEMGFSTKDVDALKSGDIDRILPLFLPDLPEHTADLISVAVRTMNRLITTNICFEKAVVVPDYSGNAAALQFLQGDMDTMTAISGDKEGMLVVADAYAGEEFGVIDMDSLDSIGEFINIVNGMFATALSEKDIQVELLPPSYMEGGVRLKGASFCKLPLLLERKPVDLIVSVGAKIELQ